MRTLAPLITAVAAAVLAAETDPAGTVLLPLGTGQSAPVTAAPGANVLCDDPAVVAPDFAEDAGDFVLRDDGRDRKSTRLNSSHSQISDAVFCFKKNRP